MTLHEYLTASLSTPFEWGKHDCVLFAASWVASRTGRNPVADLPTWKSMQRAHRIIRRVGGLEAALDRRLRRVHPNLAQDGDIALHGNTVCVFSGPHIVVPGPNGLVFNKRTEATCAWSY